jgi:hypothetical protein
MILRHAGHCQKAGKDEYLAPIHGCHLTAPHERRARSGVKVALYGSRVRSMRLLGPS